MIKWVDKVAGLREAVTFDRLVPLALISSCSSRWISLSFISSLVFEETSFVNLVLALIFSLFYQGLSRSSSNASEVTKTVPSVSVPSDPLTDKEYVIVTHVDNLANFW